VAIPEKRGSCVALEFARRWPGREGCQSCFGNQCKTGGRRKLTSTLDQTKRAGQKRQIDSSYYYVDQTYDSLGRPDVIKYPGSGVGDASGGPEADANRLRVRNNYNAYGFLMSVQDVQSGVVYLRADQVDQAGRVTREQLGNSLYTERTFDRATGNLRNIKTGEGVGGTSVQNLAMDYDRADNLYQRKDLAPGVNGGNAYLERFEYDGLYRLTMWRRYSNAAGSTQVGSEDYQYDDFGNLKQRGTSYTAYSYINSRPHAVQSVNAVGTTRTYGYDANGNLTGASAGGYGIVEWTAANLARKVSKGASYTEFTYGPDRARIKQYVFRTGTNTSTTHYAGGLLEKATHVTGGTTTVDYTHFVRSVVAISGMAKNTDNTFLNERSGFDPWGKRRDFASTTPAPIGSFVPGGLTSGNSNLATTSTTRGFTGHEQVEA
jgi:hypothetical protein